MHISYLIREALAVREWLRQRHYDNFLLCHDLALQREHRLSLLIQLPSQKLICIISSLVQRYES